MIRSVIILGCLLATARAEDLQWFTAEYLPAAEKLERAYDHCTGVTTTTVINDKNSDSVKTTYAFAFEGNSIKFDREMEIHNAEGSRTWSRTLVGTPNLSFMILTRNGKKLLEQVDRSAGGLDFANEQIDAQSDTFLAAFSLQGRPISKWLTDKHFTVKSIRKEGDAVRLDYKASRSDMTYEGWLTFLPNRQWVIDRWEIHLTKDRQPPDSWRRTGEAQYGDGDDPVPRIAAVEQVIYRPDHTEREHTIVSDLKFGPVPAAQFMLSHYGFDDRIAATVSGNSMSPWMWLAIGGVTCLLAAFVLRQVMAKRAAT